MREIFLSIRASKKLNVLLNQLENEWSEKVKINFISKLDKSLEQIRLFPQSAEESPLKKGLHRCVITKQTTIYYRFDSKKIQVVTLFDTRMDPDKLQNEIK